MTNSPRYKTLNRRLKVLRKRFLPKTFSPTGAYNDLWLDKARAFRVLSHAEIEHYFEEFVLDIADRAHRLWTTKKTATAPLLCLSCNITGDQLGLPKKIGTAISATSIVGRAISQFRFSVRNNHGVKTDNILQLLLPIGIEESAIDPAWLSSLDGFGAKRGQSAHTSSISYVIDPQDDYNTVFGQNGILEGLIPIDSLLHAAWRSTKG